MIFQPLDAIPLPLLYLLIVLVLLAATESGYRLKRAMQREKTEEEGGGMDSMVAASLALLSFLLAFMIGVGHDLIRERRNVVIKEANAIGTTFLRAGYLQEPYGKEAQNLLRKYTETRMVTNKARKLTREKLQAAIARSENIQNKLWADAERVAREDPTPITGLYVSSLNELIDVHTERVTFGTRIRVPPAILLGLFAMAILTMFLVGSQTKGKRNFMAQFVLILAISVVCYLVVDLDRSLEGLIYATQQPMIDLQQQISP